MSVAAVAAAYRIPARAVVVAPDAEAEKLLADTVSIIGDELNVKAVEIRADEDTLVSRSAKANFKSLGARLGKQMKAAAV